MRHFIFTSLATLALYATGAMAQTSQTYGSEGNWSLFKDGTGSNKACWIATQRTTPDGRQMLFMVTKIGRNDFGVTLVARSEFPVGNPIYLEMPGLRSFKFNRRLRDAWPRHASDDPKIIKALTNADASLTPVTFSFGSDVYLDYDVTGFRKALQRLKGTCIKG